MASRRNVGPLSKRWLGEYFVSVRSTQNAKAMSESATESICQPFNSDSIMACVSNPGQELDSC